MRKQDAVWLIDLDGVIWLADTPIPGASDAVNRLARSGRTVAFFTNNSFPTHDELVRKLEHFGIEVENMAVLSSAEAAARLCVAGERATVLGGAGIEEALHRRGVEVVALADAEKSRPDVVVVGIDPKLTFDRLVCATRAVHSGARLIGTNEDATYPTPTGLLPGAGSVLAAVAYATGVQPVLAGKPHEPAAELLSDHLGHVDVVVGDRSSTDGALARRLGARFALVLSGVTKAGHGPLAPAADTEASDLAVLVEDWLGVT